MPTRFGDYTIRQPLGNGGMASVHLADWRPKEGVPRRVALKRLYPHIAENPELVKMFIDEARLSRYLNHPNVAQVYEFGRLQGTYFIAFEYVEGPTVYQLAKHCYANVGYIPIPIILEIAIQLCDALIHAHNLCDADGLPLGIVHRDISPQNLIVSSVGFVKLIDFGLAKAKESSAESHSGVIKGKVHFVAPEYLDGQLDVRCDLWAVGVLLHELLSGRPLFDAPDHFKMVDLVRNMAIPPPSRFRAEVSTGLDDIVFKALERKPAKRWQNAASLRAALVAEAKEHSPVTKSQLITWVEWAFAQKYKTREDSGLAALSQIISAPFELVEEPTNPPQLPATTAAVEERRRESLAVMPIGEAMLRANKSSPWPWIIGAFVLGALAAVGFLVL
ncbi:MAG TPA: serine/threonine-protein kinase [Kofleriaceae bacterium]|nr:serine/threonine-protein kinase [Kofleriaceae bacterium]